MRYNSCGLLTAMGVWRRVPMTDFPLLSNIHKAIKCIKGKYIMEKSSSCHQNLARDLNVTFKCLCDTVQNTSELLLKIPECLNRNGTISPEIASRVVDYRSQVHSIKDVVSRRQLKVAFFGRTSSGKSTVINALLGEKILPTGLGHTTDKFVHIQGTKSSQACLITDEKKYDLDPNDFKTWCWSEIKSQPTTSVQLHWPRDRSPLLRNDDVEIIDSPGVDVDTDFDKWIDEHCSDADLFVLVLNSESTIMMREKAFFHAVTKKIAKPNLLILFNRWDCTDFENESTIIDQVKNQHLNRVCEFLVYELNVAASLQDAANQTFFISAKEALNATYHSERSHSWNRFSDYIQACLEMAAQGAKYGPLVDAGRLVAQDLDQLQGKIHGRSKTLHEEMSQDKHELEQTINKIKSIMNNDIIQVWKNQDQQTFLTNADAMISTAYTNELEDTLPHLIYDFHGSLMNEDPDIIKIYKKNLMNHIEVAFMEELQSRLSIQLIFFVENQRNLFQNKLSNYKTFGEYSLKWPTMFDDTNTNIIHFPNKMELKIEPFIEDPVGFSFSFSPKKLYNKWTKSKTKGLFTMNKNRAWPLWTHVMMVTEGQLAVAGIVFKYFNQSRAFMRVLLSFGLCYGGLYAVEFLCWSFSGKERQIKEHCKFFTSEQLAEKEVYFKSNLKTQINNYLNGFLSLLTASVENYLSELNDNLLEQELQLQDLQFTIDSCANLSCNLQGILFDFDAAERILLLETNQN